jgi:hypothetical protein
MAEHSKNLQMPDTLAIYSPPFKMPGGGEQLNQKIDYYKVLDRPIKVRRPDW